MFDSGIGGLSVLQAARRALPGERFLYYADTANAPYGVKTQEQVRALSLRAADKLLARGIKALLVACNTATCASASLLRDRLPIPVVGVTPALGRAARMRRDGAILVMATPVTLNTPTYAALFAQYGEHAISLPCPGLMDFVERGDTNSDALCAFLTRLLSPYLDMRVDVVVLGCTHYAFLRDAIQGFFSADTRVIDGYDDSISALRDALSEKCLLNAATVGGSVELLSSGGETAVARMRALMDK